MIHKNQIHSHGCLTQVVIGATKQTYKENLCTEREARRHVCSPLLG